MKRFFGLVVVAGVGMVVFFAVFTGGSHLRGDFDFGVTPEEACELTRAVERTAGTPEQEEIFPVWCEIRDTCFAAEGVPEVELTEEEIETLCEWAPAHGVDIEACEGRKPTPFFHQAPELE